MQVGIIPTDTLPALVAPLEDREAVARLYGAKQLDPKKPLSILVRNFQDVAHYTAGFPAPQPGQPNWFNVMKKLLPGPVSTCMGCLTGQHHIMPACPHSAHNITRASTPP
jgi:tRNA A37 threonylcarbamoyladenosine synthetase subunit TsaC/SUA5/YrdC